jgi:hypothetical protein
VASLKKQIKELTMAYQLQNHPRNDDKTFDAITSKDYPVHNPSIASLQ